MNGCSSCTVWYWYCMFFTIRKMCPRILNFFDAFIQAAATETIFLHLPQGFQSSKGPNTCLKRLCSHYSLWFGNHAESLGGGTSSEGGSHKKL